MIEEDWDEVIKRYVDAEIIQIVTSGTLHVDEIIKDNNIELDEEITALVFDHNEFVFKTTKPQELDTFFENQP